MKKLLFISLLSFLGANSQNGNLLINGGFESATSNFPDSWTSTIGDISINNTTFTEGLNSVRVSPEVDPLMPGLPTSLISQTFQLTDTDDHTFTFKYFLPGSVLSNAIDLISYGFENTTPNNAYFFTSGGVITSHSYDNWVTITYTVKVLLFRNGATSTDIKFALRTNAFNSSNAEVFYDDFFLDSNIALSIEESLQANSKIVNYIEDKVIYLSNNNNANSYLIYSLDGKEILGETSILNNVINAQNIKNGLYIMVFKFDDNSVLSKKIILK